ELQMNKVSACWVPHLLIPLQKQTRHDIFQQNLTLLEQNEDFFFARLVTMDECWVYLYDLETKEMSKEWKHPSFPTPKKAKVQKSAGKKLCDALKQKRYGMISKGVHLPADNAPVHTDQASVVTAHRLGYELLQHPPYSHDLVPSNFFLFPEMKKPLRGRRFDNREDVILEV
ncbi:hypothetical protein JRQ81_000533, partial [Phrynocephalus forsythii]